MENNIDNMNRLRLNETYSPTLEAAMADRPWGEAEARQVDEKLRSIYSDNGVSAFCYLLFDPRKFDARVENVTLSSFVDAIFYVGKGTGARPLHHLIDAKRLMKFPEEMSNKTKIIHEIWDAEKGVIALQMSHHIDDDEALTREAAIIEAIGLANLSNVKPGMMQGTTKTWSAVQRAQLGTLLLVRARNILVAEGHIKQIFPNNLPNDQQSLWKNWRNKSTQTSAIEAGTSTAS